MLKKHLWRLYYRLRFYLGISRIFKLLKFQSLRNDFYRELWQQAAESLGADLEAWGGESYRVRRDNLATFVHHSSVMLDDHLMLEIMGNKAMTYALLEEKGCRVPKYRAFTMRSFDKAESFLKEHMGPVVVKPASGTGAGHGVTTWVTDKNSLRKASRLAARFSESIIVEEQLEGDSFRLLYLGGEFIDAIRRDPPRVVGNGQDTIRHLVTQENNKRLKQRPITALSPLMLDADAHNKLNIQGLTPRSTPSKGRVVVVKTAVNENCAGSNHRVKELVHPSVVAFGQTLVNDLGVQFAGLDLICRDITVPLSQSGGVINEINTTPGLHHHYLLSDGTNTTPVADLVLAYIFETGQGLMKIDKTPLI